MLINSCFSLRSLGSMGNFCMDCVYEKGVDWLSAQVLKYRIKIFYAGAISSSLSLLAALVGRVACSLFYALPAVVCLGLAAWAFQQREAEVSQALGSENEKLSQALADSENQLENEKKIKGELFQYNQEFAHAHEEQLIEIQQLRENNEDLQGRVDSYREQNEVLQESLDWFEGLLARLGELGQQITREKNSDYEEDPEL